MNKLLQFTFLEFKMVFRVPISIFFSFLFPQLLLFTLMTTSQNPIISGNVHFVDIYFPSLSLLTLLTSGITSFSILVSINRSEKFWQTYILKGFKLYHIIFSQLFVYIILSFISTLLVIISSNLFYRLILPSFNDFIIFCLLWFLSAFIIFLIGFFIGSFSKNEKVAQQTSTVIMFVLMVFTGTFGNISSFPQYVLNFVKFLPTSQIYYILYNYWGNSWITGNLEKFAISWEILFIWAMILLISVIWKLKKDNLTR